MQGEGCLDDALYNQNVFCMIAKPNSDAQSSLTQMLLAVGRMKNLNSAGVLWYYAWISG
jgi:hypothetical protein